MKQCKVSGSYTIEAALVFPIVFFSIVAVIYLAVYFHDITTLKGIVNEVASRASNASVYQVHLSSDEYLSYEERIDKGLYWRFTSDSQNSQISIIQQMIREQAEKSLIMSDTRNMQINVEVKNYIIDKKIIIKVTKPFSTSIAPVNKILNNTHLGLSMHIETIVTVKEPAEVIRTMNFLDTTSDKIVGIQDIKESYEKKVDEIVKILDGTNKQ